MLSGHIIPIKDWPNRGEGEKTNEVRRVFKIHDHLYTFVISYKQYLECTLIQWRLSIYP